MSALPDQTSQSSRGGAGPVLPRPGLRERKKAKTRAAIQAEAIRLFRQQGYEATTVEQIAAAAEVSPSTFFRYFPTKEDVLLRDDMDELWAEIFRAQPAGLAPIPAIRATMRTAFTELPPEALAQLREATNLALAVPAVRARVLDEFARTLDVMAEAIAQRSGRNPGDVAVRTLAGMVLGVMLAAWFDSGGDLDKFADRADIGLELMEHPGLPL